MVGKQLRPWFTDKDRKGDRTLEQQLVGLEPLLRGRLEYKRVGTFDELTVFYERT